MLPHKEKILKGGEDAVAAAEGLVCVSDGVGGWAMSGVDPAVFARDLIKNTVEIYEKEE